MHLHPEPHGAQLRERFHRQGHLRHLGHHRIDIGRRGLHGQALGFDELEHALHPEGPTHGRRGFTAQLLNQVVVAPATTNGALRPELIGDEFKDREVVVIHAPDQARVQPVSHPVGPQHRLHGLKVSHRVAAQKINQSRCGIDQVLHLRVFAVQNPQRIGMQPPERIFVQLGLVGLKISHQRLAVLQTLLGLTQTVELQFNAFEPQTLPQRMGHQNELGVELWTGKTQRLGPHLVKLAVTPALGALVSEHGAGVIKALGSIVEQVVLHDRTHHPRRRLWPQGQLLPVQAVFKGVHLFFNNVGDLAQTPDKERTGLNDGGANVLIGMAAHQGTHTGLEPLPQVRVGRQNVIHAFDGGDFFSHTKFSIQFINPRGLA